MSVSASHHRYIAVETGISIAINGAISAGMFQLLLGGQPVIARSAGIVDTVPQTFMIALMSALVPGFVTRRRVAAGVVRPRIGTGLRLPQNLVARALLVAIVATILLGGLAILSLIAIAPDPIPNTPFFVAKIAYGMLVAAIVTPVAVASALADPYPAIASPGSR